MSSLDYIIPLTQVKVCEVYHSLGSSTTILPALNERSPFPVRWAAALLLVLRVAFLGWLLFSIFLVFPTPASSFSVLRTMAPISPAYEHFPYWNLVLLLVLFISLSIFFYFRSRYCLLRCVFRSAAG